MLSIVHGSRFWLAIMQNQQFFWLMAVTSDTTGVSNSQHHDPFWLISHTSRKSTESVRRVNGTSRSGQAIPPLTVHKMLTSLDTTMRYQIFEKEIPITHLVIKCRKVTTVHVANHNKLAPTKNICCILNSRSTQTSYNARPPAHVKQATNSSSFHDVTHSLWLNKM